MSSAGDGFKLCLRIRLLCPCVSMCWGQSACSWASSPVTLAACTYSLSFVSAVVETDRAEVMVSES